MSEVYTTGRISALQKQLFVINFVKNQTEGKQYEIQNPS